MSETCTVCGEPIEVGDYPCISRPRPHVKGFNGVIDDQIEGGPRFFETFGHDPVWIGSKSEWRAAVDRYQVEHVDRHDRAYYQRQFKQHDERLRDTRA